MRPQSELSEAQEERLQEVLAGYLRDVEAGRNPDQAELLARHPDLAGELQSFFAGQEQIGRLAAPLRQAVEPSLDVGITGTLGDFRIVREVGRGGMGIVYESEQISLRRRVALKVLPFAATMDPRHLQRFHNEAQAAACLHHTNIVPVHFVGCERGVHFYAMQFIDGQPLSEIIRQLRRAEKPESSAGIEQTAAYQSPTNGAIQTSPTTRPVAEVTPLTSEGRRDRDYYRTVAELGVQAAEALDHAHQLGIVHRDIKPANLLLDARGNLWITDFGLAHIQHSEASLTLTGQAVGTPRYMSPEQALSKRVPIDHRTDVYSLGVTLYELLTLRPAFTSEDRHELVRQIAFEEPDKPRRVERAIPSELETIVLEAMEKRPQDRYATAQELVDDLRRWLLDKPIHARKPTWLQVGRKWMRRHQSMVRVVSVLLLLLLALGTANAFWWIQKQTAAEAEARVAFDEAVRWQQNERWSEALSAIRRAQGVLRGFWSNASLRQQIDERGKDLEMAQRLVEARLEYSQTKDEELDRDGCIAAYEEAFACYGLDVEQGNTSATAKYIRAHSIPIQLVAALDDWANLLRLQKRRQECKQILEVVRAADPDEWRNRFRDASVSGDVKTMDEMLASAEVENLLSSPLSFRLSLRSFSDEEYASVSASRTESILRKAQQRYPADFWINYYLSTFFTNTRPPHLEDATRHSMIAVALRPQSSAAHNGLGYDLATKGQLDEAIAEFREAIRLKPDVTLSHNNLGDALRRKGQLDDAIAECREAIRLKKDSARAHTTLGVALYDKGQPGEAIAEYREAIRLKKDYAPPHHNIACSLSAIGQWDEAITEFREALRIKKDLVAAHSALGIALFYKARLDEGNKAQLDEAIAECRKAIELDPNFYEAHSNLGLVLAAKGQLDEAIAEHREAIRIKKDYVNARVNLGNAFRQKGQFKEAIAEIRVGLQLVKDFDPEGYTISNRKGSLKEQIRNELREVEQLSMLDGRLPYVLEGSDQPKDAAECAAFADLCAEKSKRLYAAAAHFYASAFAEERKLADDLDAGHRYNAACAATMAGCGQGEDADKLDAKERARLRQQALDWLRADLKANRQLMEKSAGKAGHMITERMQHWLADPDFAGVRGATSLAKLPEAERKEWQKLWADVTEMLAKVQSKTATEKKSDRN